MQRIIFFIVGIVFLAGCKEKYDLPLTSSNQSLLVVEGNLTIGGPTNIRLTKTFRLEDSARVQPVNGAILQVEGKDNSVQVITSSGNGNYTSPGLNLLPGNEYRLRIRTIDGKEFLSDYIIAKLTPPIDSISWEKKPEGVTIFANTHDPSNTSKYYKWDYVETWEYNAPYYTNLTYENGRLRSRIFPQEDIHKCWSTISSSSIFLANSVSLQTDIISKAPLVFIPQNDDKLSVRYSIIVKQFALTKEAYTFYEILKKNTETIGTFFGPMPSEITGNIKCISNSDEPVVGFITASSVIEKRIFIANAEVRPWNKFIPCIEKKVVGHPDSIRLAIFDGFLPTSFLDPEPQPWSTYLFFLPICVDCRERGGVTTKPSFW